MTTVLVMGKGALAIRVAGWFARSAEHELVYVVPVVPEPAWTDSFLGWADDAGIPHVPTGRLDDVPGVHEDGWHVDLAVSVTYSHIVRPWFIERCGRILNIHNAPLPRYRGVSPINWALKNGETSHGVTIHEITPGIDDGPIVAQVTFSIYPELDEVIDVYERCQAHAWTLFEHTMPILDRIEAREQDHSQATYYTRAQNDQLGDRRSFTRAESVA